MADAGGSRATVVLREMFPNTLVYDNPQKVIKTLRTISDEDRAARMSSVFTWCDAPQSEGAYATKVSPDIQRAIRATAQRRPRTVSREFSTGS